MGQTILVTGAAGFIGMHVSRALLARGDRVIGVDNVNDYYPVALKEARIAHLMEGEGADRFTLHRLDFADDGALNDALAGAEIDGIVHLGAQPGVRYSIDHPMAYARSNLVGHLALLELARHRRVRHMVYASSSSVYGDREDVPFAEADRVDQPISLYAATKKADELMSESYAHLYRLPLTGLRFFTVYGPWGRPDMAAWLFTDAILNGRPFRLFANGDLMRDFTYIDDIVAGVIAALDRPPLDDGSVKAGGSRSPHRVWNIGNNQPEPVRHMVDLIAAACGRDPVIEHAPMQPGDVTRTFASIDAIQSETDFAPRTPLDQGIPCFVDWFRKYTRHSDA